MDKQKKFQIVFILLFFFCAIVFGQDKQLEDDGTKKLRKEILKVFKTRGEKGLRQFVKDNKKKISNQFILDFVEYGLKMNFKDEIETIKQELKDADEPDLMKEMKNKIEKLDDSDLAKKIGKQYYNYFKDLNKFMEGSTRLNQLLFKDGPKLIKEWLTIARIMAEEKKDQKLLADVYAKIAPADMALNLLPLFRGFGPVDWKKEILTVYNTEGEKGLREFVQDNKEHIENQLIEEFAKSGFEKGKTGWLSISRVIAEEKKAENILTDIYLKYAQKGFYTFQTDAATEPEQQTAKQTGKLKTLILTIYNAKGETGLRQFVRNNAKKISHQFIVNFAQSGFEEDKKEWMEIAKIIADEKKDEKALAAVNSKTARYKDFKEPGTDDLSQDERFKKEILIVYESEGETGLRQFVKDNKKKINRQFIEDFLQYALKEQGWEAPEIAKILAEEKKDEKALADINFKIAGYNAIFDLQDEEAQDNIFMHAMRPKDDATKRLEKEIIAVYKTKGETGLRQFVKDKNKKIIHRLTMSFAGSGWVKLKKEWLEIAKIMADETKNKKVPIATIDSLIKVFNQPFNGTANSMADFWGLNKQPKDENAEKLRKDILNVYNTKRGKGLRQWVKDNKKKVTHQLIVDLAQSGFEEGKKEKLIIAKMMADQLKDERALKAVYAKIGQYSANDRFGYYSSVRDKQLKDDNAKTLRKEILAVYNTKRETGLRQWVKDNKNKCNHQLIVDLAQSGFEEGKIEWLNISKMMAEEKKDQKTLDVVDFKMKQHHDFRKLLAESAIISKNKANKLIIPPSNSYLILLDALLDSQQDYYQTG